MKSPHCQIPIKFVVWVRGGLRSPRTTPLDTPIHNILSTAPQLIISQKALGTLPEDGNVMPKQVEADIHNK
jgi:hypothetical protein